MPLDDVGVVLLEQRVHLLDLLRLEGLDDVELVVRVVEARPALARRPHRLGALGERAHERRVLDAEALAEVAKD